MSQMEEAEHVHLRLVDDESIPEPAEYLDAVFGVEGYLAKRFEGYRQRKGQIDLTRAVDRAMREGVHLFAEGPTGTGKSLAYCVPASYHSALSEDPDAGKVVIATANIALQEQLVEKDLPLLQEILPWEVSFGLLKGLANYLCLDELETTEARQGGLFDKVNTKAATDRYEKIREWTDETTTGDKNELPFDPGAEWAKFSTTTDECKGTACDYSDKCFGRGAQRTAKESKIIVTNYHMLFAHLRLMAESDGLIGLLPPGIDFVIMDEAHKAADIAREFFGFEIRVGTLRNIARKLRRENETGSADWIEERANRMFNFLTELRDDPERYRTRIKQRNIIEDHDELTGELKSLGDWFHELSEEIVRPPAKSKESKRKRDLQLTSRRCHDVAGSIDSAMALTGDPVLEPDAEQQVVYYLGGKAHYEPATLKASVVNVGPILNTWLFGAHRSVTCTSATLAGVGGRFDYPIKELGSPPEQTATLLAETPFDFKKQALLVVPSDLPMPSGKDQNAYREAVVEYTARAIELARGRTLCLFTSYKNLNLAYEHLKDRCAYRVLKQGQRPRTQLVEIFKSDESSVLLGTESFWAGVDVPGPALSCVVIDRIPFPTPDDPVLDAISERNDKWFFDYSVPRAQIQLKQGFGRLIRALDDRGCVVMLDRRLIDKNYGRQFIESLPPVLKTRNIEAVREFLG